MAPKGPEAESPSPTNGSVRKRTEALSPSLPRKKTPPLSKLLNRSSIILSILHKMLPDYVFWISFGLDTRKQRRRSIPLVMHKRRRRRRILPFNPTEDPVRRFEQMGSLATALTTLQMEFSNELTYMAGMAPRSANQAILEKGGMQVLPREDKETLKLCRAMYKRGECPPLLVVYDSLEGFTVQADGHLKDMTFIAEYTGDVDYLLNRQHDDCDSIMTLLSATNPSDSLVVCPDKRGNIARFINGINNHNQESRKKQNIKCVRYDVDGECRALLVACRDIACGERLYYDYNGCEQEYPTQHFI
ncbi:hypothetical protein COCNU_15G001330 [Cocos nucifera]|uniref:[histone H3]-lysine(27) N-methyltransferase n=1 Tax=Cocos nucifera TaxID=13894 RepID=A0A8K0IY57_COCNU|nr:hypothetical protein COCNU_15G001330 [Cocos nucifera]